MPTSSIPPALVESIRNGNCVAFVGAGFSAPALPPWSKLLKELAKDLDAEDRAELLSWLERTDLASRDYEAIAGMLEEQLGDGDGLDTRIREIFRANETIEGAKLVQERVDVLSQIPFHLVLTTNYDRFLPSSRVPDAATFGEMLTMEPRRWTRALRWDQPTARGVDPARVLKLHGDLEQPQRNPVVLAARGYRGRTHQLAGYRPFLRAVFATKTILFAGFSFTDAYINDLRSEVLSVLGLEGAHRGRDYVISSAFTAEARRYYAKHEGLEVIPYEAAPKDERHEGFDERLRELRDLTSPEATLKRLLADRRILWFDPAPENNAYGRRRLAELEAVAPTSVTSVEAALDELARDPSYHLVISHFGYSETGESNAEILLKRMRSEGRAVPVIVFASGAERSVNRPKVLRLGAFAYEHQWGALFDRIEDLFLDGPEGWTSRPGNPAQSEPQP